MSLQMGRSSIKLSCIAHLGTSIKRSQATAAEDDDEQYWQRKCNQKETVD